MRKLYSVTICFLMLFSLKSQDSVKIKTSAICESCKNRLESKMTKMKGVKSAVVNLDDKTLTVYYDKLIISTDLLEDKVTEIGYDANDKLAKKAAYKRLPACCRKEYQGKH